MAKFLSSSMGHNIIQDGFFKTLNIIGCYTGCSHNSHFSHYWSQENFFFPQCPLFSVFHWYRLSFPSNFSFLSTLIVSHFWYSSQSEKNKSCSPSWDQDPFKSRLDEPYHELGTLDGISLLIMQSSRRASCFVYLVEFWGKNKCCCSHKVSWCSEPHPEKETLQWTLPAWQNGLSTPGLKGQ